MRCCNKRTWKSVLIGGWFKVSAGFFPLSIYTKSTFLFFFHWPNSQQQSFVLLFVSLPDSNKLSLLNDSFPAFHPTVCDLVPGWCWHRICRIFILSSLTSQYHPGHTTNSTLSTTHVTSYVVSLITGSVIFCSQELIDDYSCNRWQSAGCESTFIFKRTNAAGTIPGSWRGRRGSAVSRHVVMSVNCLFCQTWRKVKLFFDYTRWKTELGRGRTSKSFKNSPTR